MIQTCKQFFSLLGLCFCVVTIMCAISISYSTKKVIAETRCDYSEKICSIGKSPIYFDSKEVHFTSKEIQTSFTLQNCDDIVSISFENSGIDIITYEFISKNRIILLLDYDYSAQNHSLTMIIFLSNGNTVTAKLYAIDNDTGIFISPFSLNDAFENYYIYARKKSFLSQNDCERMRNKMNSSSVIDESIDIESNMSDKSLNEGFFNSMHMQMNFGDSLLSRIATLGDKSTYVKGTLNWIDDANVTHPLRKVMIRIYDKETIGETLLGTVYSDNEGNFSFTFQNKDGFWDFENGGLDIFIRVYAGDTNAIVKIGSSNDDYYYESTVSENMTTGSTKLCKFYFHMNSDLGRAFQISQALLTGRDYALNMLGQMPKSVTLRYPYDNGCYYESGSSKITITGHSKTVATMPESYASWDVIMHEYGHHIEYQMGLINSPGGSHTFSSNLADERGNKSDGVRLAWSEAWATIFGMVSQSYCKAYLVNIASVCDSNYDAYNFYNSYDIENAPTKLGEACEGSIMAVLWDIFDSNADIDDFISMGANGFWNATAKNQSKTFSDFIETFYKKYPQYIGKIGANLTRYQMAPSMPVMANSNSVSQEIPPTFYWDPQGGSTIYPNNKFRLVFYDSMGLIAFKTNYTTLNNYTLNNIEWDSVLHTYGRTYTVAVAGMQTNEDYITGEYISASTTSYSKPIPISLTENIILSQNNRYAEKIVDLLPTQYIDYNLNFAVDSNQIIQTFGTKDSRIYLYDSSGVLLSFDDNHGYALNALISYNFKCNTTYTLRVQFSSGNDSGKIKIAIIPKSTLCSSFDLIYECNNNYNSYSGNISILDSALLRYKVDSSKSITFTTDCSFDAYLYIIDPRSTEAISSNLNGASIYNDDGGGNFQARITKELDSNISYLIILTSYNPSIQSGNYIITFRGE